jgi:hypothetical protein
LGPGPFVEENVQEIFRRFKLDDVLRDLEQVGRLYARKAKRP